MGGCHILLNSMPVVAVCLRGRWAWQAKLTRSDMHSTLCYYLIKFLRPRGQIILIILVKTSGSVPFDRWPRLSKYPFNCLQRVARWSGASVPRWSQMATWKEPWSPQNTEAMYQMFNATQTLLAQLVPSSSSGGLPGTF